MFELNQKIVCVNDTRPPGVNDIFNAWPSKGKIYTVRDIVPGVQFSMEETCAVYLQELVNTPNRHNIEPGFKVTRFKEINEEAAAKYAENQNIEKLS